MQTRSSAVDQSLVNYEPTTVDLATGRSEYFLQVPTPEEKKRRELSHILKNHSIERVFWSKTEITRDTVALNLGDKNIEDFVLSEIRGFVDTSAELSLKNFHVVIVASATLNESEIRSIWESMTPPHKPAKAVRKGSAFY
jgi:hypothetical protein